jgi:MFS family permease
MTPVARSISSEIVSRLLSVLAIISASVAVTFLLFPNPLADVFFAGIILLSVIFALIGGIGAWTNRTPLVWVAALLLTGLSILGMMSIGFLLAPAALLLLGAAIFSQMAGLRTDVRKAITTDPPMRQEILQKMLLGIGSVAGGLGLVYVSAFKQELFGSCANETVVCALETTNWSAVGLTVLGLVGISVGGWLIWKQIYITRVLASTQTQ